MSMSRIIRVSDANVQQNQQDITGATTGNAQVLGAIYTKSSNEADSNHCGTAPNCLRVPALPGGC